MKIIMVSYRYYPDFGGEINVGLERFESLVRRGYSVEVLTGAYPGLARRETINGVKIFRARSLGRSRIARLLQRIVFHLSTAYFLIRSRADTLHLASVGRLGNFYTYLIFLFLLWVGKVKGMRVVRVNSLVDSNENPLDLSGWHNWSRKKFLRSVDVLVNVSPLLNESCLSYGLKNSTVACCGVKDGVFRPLRKNEYKDINRKYNISPDAKYFISIGAVGYRKGTDLMIEAMEKFENTVKGQSDWGLILIGPESSEVGVVSPSEIRGRAGKNVHFLGRIDDADDLVKLLNACDIFLFPTRREGFGIAPLEAMSCGVPVIVSRIKGVTDIASVEGETGLYVEPGDGSALLDAMEILASNAELVSAMGGKGRLRIVKQFGWEDYINRWEEIYSGVSCN